MPWPGRRTCWWPRAPQPSPTGIRKLHCNRWPQELGVEHILEGSVRRAGERIRVTAQLIRAADGFHLWSQNYDRDAADIIDIQEELAVAIARALKTTMDPAALEAMLGAGTRNVEAYELYLRGIEASDRASNYAAWQQAAVAIDAFDRARTLDPQFAAAHAQAARYWVTQLTISSRGDKDVDLSLAERMTRFREAIDAAIATAPNAIDRQKYEANLARVEMRVRDQLRLAKSVLESRPYDLEAINDLVFAAIWSADRETLHTQMDKAWQLHDQGFDWAYSYVQDSWRIAGEFYPDRKTYIERTEQILRRYPSPGIAYQAHRAFLWMGETERAARLLPLLAGDEEGQALVQARQACAEGRRGDAEAILTSLDQDDAEGSAVRAWHIHMMLGQQEEAAAVLRPFETMDSPVTIGAYLVYAQFDPARHPVAATIIQRERIIRDAPVMPGFMCPAAGSDRPSVAVLPFRAMSSGADDEYFADGLTEEILNTLAQVPELLVTARTSSFYFKGRDLPVPEIAAQLGVAHVVEGSVRRSGEQVRITAQLIRAADGFHLWSNTYDRTLEDAFGVQEDIARNIAETLDIVLDEEKLALMQRSGIGELNAFIAFQKGRELFVEAHESLEDIGKNIPVMVPYFEEALAVSPGLVAAWIYKADATAHVVFDIASGRRAEQFPGEAEQGQRAIAGELNQAWEYARAGNQRDILDVERTLFRDSWEGLGQKLERAVRPSDCPRDNWTGELATTMLSPEKVRLKVVEQQRCDPLNELVAFHHAYSNLWAGNPGEAVRLSREAVARGISFDWLNGVEFAGLLAQGDFAGAALVKDQGEELLPFPRALLLAAASGDLQTARGLAVAHWESEWATDWSSLLAAALIGDRERANAFAARIDARPGGQLVLNNATFTCLCGSPFDLEATPNFARRLAEAGIVWSPNTVINFPGKDW